MVDIEMIGRKVLLWVVGTVVVPLVPILLALVFKLIPLKNKQSKLFPSEAYPVTVWLFVLSTSVCTMIEISNTRYVEALSWVDGFLFSIIPFVVILICITQCVIFDVFDDIDYERKHTIKVVLIVGFLIAISGIFIMLQSFTIAMIVNIVTIATLTIIYFVAKKTVKVDSKTQGE
jgi:hypothetical protein